MKKFIIICLAALVPLLAAAQAPTTSFDRLFRKLSGVSGYTTLEITNDMLKLMNKDNGGDNQAFNNIESIRVVAADKASEEFLKEIVRLTEDEYEYSHMTTVNEEGQRTELYYHKPVSRKDTPEYILVIYGPRENTVISILGYLDIQNISGLSGLGIAGK